jgi:hypothetical protein
MTVTMNRAVAADRELLSKARRLLDAHVTSSVTGRCLACGTPGPCYKRENAVVIFSRTLRLLPHQPARPEPIVTRDAD